MSLASTGFLLGPGQGESYWFFNSLATLKAGGAHTSGAFTLMELTIPPNFGPPPHIHHREDEGFYLLDGELTVTCGDNTWRAGPGSFLMLPQGVPHSFLTWEAGPVRMLQITSPAQFEQYAEEMGERAAQAVLPEPGAIDPEQVMRIGAKYGIEFLRPPTDEPPLA